MEETPKVTVAIPVGPETHHQQWLDESIASVIKQTYRHVDEILLIDDMADLPQPDLLSDAVRVWRSPWRLGVASAMNFGVALAKNELVFMLCSDDTLHPECIARCVDAYKKIPEEDQERSYFFVGVKYLDDREENEQFVPCGAAMVTKSLWKLNGGFQPESSSGAPDAALISTMMVHREAGQYVGVGQGISLYNYRPHPNSDTAGRYEWQGVILSTRDLLTKDWRRPTWGRFE